MESSLDATRGRLGHPFKLPKPPWIHSHGAGSSGQALTIPIERVLPAAAARYGWNITTRALAPAEYFGSPAGVVTNWGEVAYQKANMKATNEKVILTGTSMGAFSSFRMALEHPNEVACIAVTLPLIDLQWVRDQDVVEGLALRAAIDTAWGVAYPAALPAAANVLGLINTISHIPILMYVAGNDDISHNYQQFATNHGNTKVIQLGPYDHGNVPLSAFDTSKFLDFLLEFG